MEPDYRLHYAPDNASLIVRLALEELGQPYATVLVDRAVQAQEKPAYRALNPAGLIPVLETPDGPIFETAAILLWLADRHGALAPAPDSHQRAAFLKWLFFTSNTLHTALRMRFYPARYVGPDKDAQKALSMHMQDEVARHLDLVEAAAANRPGWLVGADPSVLDLYLACLMRWSRLYPVDEDKGWANPAHRPHLRDMAARLETRPSVISRHPCRGAGQHPPLPPPHTPARPKATPRDCSQATGHKGISSLERSF